MDRRRALKRLAAGGTAAVGASLIVSQPAFAYTNPVVTGSPTVSITTLTDLTARINISNVPVATCPASALSRPAPVRTSLTWQTFWPGGPNVEMSTGSGTTVSIPGNFTTWFVNDRIRVTMIYRYRCVYAGSTSEICVRWFREFRATTGGAGANWALVGASSTGPTVVPCTSGLAAAPLFAPSSGASGRTADGTPTG